MKVLCLETLLNDYLLLAPKTIFWADGFKLIHCSEPLASKYLTPWYWLDCNLEIAYQKSSSNKSMCQTSFWQKPLWFN